MELIKKKCLLFFALPCHWFLMNDTTSGNLIALAIFHLTLLSFIAINGHQHWTRKKKEIIKHFNSICNTSALKFQWHRGERNKIKKKRFQYRHFIMNQKLKRKNLQKQAAIALHKVHLLLRHSRRR